PEGHIRVQQLIQYTNRRHRGRSTTPRNQQHENFLQKRFLFFLLLWD
ncbi:unnamed protein product, partial [Brassica oleracea]